MLSRTNISQACNDYPSPTSTCRSDFETSYTQYNRRRSSLSPSPTPISTTWSGNTTSNNDTLSRHDNTLYSVLKSPRALKTTTHQYRSHHHRHHHNNNSNNNYTSSDDHEQPNHRPQSTIRSSPYHTTRGNHRLPSIIDRMKAELMSPTKSIPRSHNDYHSPKPSNSELTAAYEDSLLQSPPPPSLFGVRCTAISQKAYSGQSSQMKKSFDRLQRMDNGKVEYRTIAFCTHLTVTRWEPVVPVTNSSMPSDGENPNIDSTNNGQTHAARLMSLANYIRHILSLTVAVPNAQSQAKARQPQKKDEPRSRNPNMNSDSTTTSSGPGPIKSESNRRHRFSPAYHRRNTPHSNELGYREGSHSTEQQPQSKDYQSQESHPHTPHDVNSVQHSQQPTLAPLLKIPFPNLTLTLALIYVDRLKAKYPEAKGEPGCSQRLFLVAFIIAAKYRCSVDLSPPVPQDLNGEDQDQESMSSNYDDSLNGDESLDDVFNSEAKLEARLNAELIFSNHAWVRLLNLGSFYRQPSATPSATGAITESREQTPQDQSESTHPSLSASSTESQAQGSRPSLSSIMNPATSSPTAGMLQVEDLDRMEAEFLTFLEFDLATMSHDLETCWNLLVGKNETQL